MGELSNTLSILPGFLQSHASRRFQDTHDLSTHVQNCDRIVI
jgi:hypothetical protein